jgi:hypothetical protein
MASVRDIMKWASWVVVIGAVGGSMIASSVVVSGCSSGAEPTLNPQPLPPNNPDPTPTDPNPPDKQTGPGGGGGGSDNGSATSAASSGDGGAEGGDSGGGG